MADLLSQDEIDALLHGVDDVEEDIAEIDGGSEESLVHFDFSSQDRIVQDVCQPWSWLMNDLRVI